MNWTAASPGDNNFHNFLDKILDMRIIGRVCNFAELKLQS